VQHGGVRWRGGAGSSSWPAPGRRELAVGAGEGGRRRDGLPDVGGCRGAIGRRQAREGGSSMAWDGAGLLEASRSSMGQPGVAGEAGKQSKKIRGKGNG
jgi:hypothetical protein